MAGGHLSAPTGARRKSTLPCGHPTPHTRPPGTVSSPADRQAGCIYGPPGQLPSKGQLPATPTKTPLDKVRTPGGEGTLGSEVRDSDAAGPAGP